MDQLMPRGICSGCGDLTCLPPFGDGLCFLCATDGPPGSYSPTIGAVDEDSDARHIWPEMSEPDEERRVFVLEEFAEHQMAWTHAIHMQHFCSQRFEQPVPPLGLRLARRGSATGLLWEFQRIIAASAGHSAHVEHVASVIRRRGGTGHYADPASVERAIELRRQGMSLRTIASETGLNRGTVRAYVPVVTRSEAMRAMHVRLRAEGRPLLPPWQRNRLDRAYRGEAAGEKRR